MVPGKTHISLTVAWALDHDPVAAVKKASARDAIPEDEDVDLHAGNMVGLSTLRLFDVPGISTPQSAMGKRLKWST